MFDAARRRDGALMIGTPEQLTEKILDAQAQLGITRFIGQFDWGGLPPARVHESIARAGGRDRARRASHHPCDSGMSDGPESGANRLDSPLLPAKPTH
jgi:hypothetical protein